MSTTGWFTDCVRHEHGGGKGGDDEEDRSHSEGDGVAVDESR